MKFKKKTLIILTCTIFMISIYYANQSIHSKRLAMEVLDSINMDRISSSVHQVKVNKVKDALIVPDYISYYIKFKAKSEDIRYLLQSGVGDVLSWKEYQSLDTSGYMNLFGDFVIWFNPDTDNSKVIIPNLGETSTTAVVLVDTAKSFVYLKVKVPTGY